MLRKGNVGLWIHALGGVSPQSPLLIDDATLRIGHNPCSDNVFSCFSANACGRLPETSPYFPGCRPYPGTNTGVRGRIRGRCETVFKSAGTVRLTRCLRPDEKVEDHGCWNDGDCNSRRRRKTVPAVCELSHHTIGCCQTKGGATTQGHCMNMRDCVLRAQQVGLAGAGATATHIHCR